MSVLATRFGQSTRLAQSISLSSQSVTHKISPPTQSVTHQPVPPEASIVEQHLHDNEIANRNVEVVALLIAVQLRARDVGIGTEQGTHHQDNVDGTEEVEEHHRVHGHAGKILLHEAHEGFLVSVASSELVCLYSGEGKGSTLYASYLYVYTYPLSLYRVKYHRECSRGKHN